MLYKPGSRLVDRQLTFSLYFVLSVHSNAIKHKHDIARVLSPLETLNLGKYRVLVTIMLSRLAWDPLPRDIPDLDPLEWVYWPSCMFNVFPNVV